MTYDTDPYHIAGPEHDPARPGETPASQTPRGRTPESVLASRCYGGFVSGEFKERALDLEAMDKGRRRPGMAQRLRACLTNIVTRFTLAMDAYMKVRRALKALTAAPNWPAPPRYISKPRKPWMWRRAPLSNAQWQQLDAAHGFDMRGASPAFIARRARAIRNKRRLEAEPEFFKATKPERDDPAPFIGPPLPREHSGVDDLFMIWPPITVQALEALQADPETPDSPALEDTPMHLRFNHLKTSAATHTDKTAQPRLENTLARIRNDAGFADLVLRRVQAVINDIDEGTPRAYDALAPPS